jgi:serine/threonine protein kinase/Tol biopolymer transport system component
MAGPSERLIAALRDSYRLEGELGAGGMATVYRARDLKHDRTVAVKVLRPDLAAILGADRFLAEIKTTAALQHPHILPLFDSGEAAGYLYYVMPLVEGESLRDRLGREKQLSMEEAIRITTEVAGALDYAHRHGVIHRDIKPENVLLHEGTALLADFGVALAVKEAGGPRLTETGASVGTPQYMSPEQATGERELDARSDLYALAAVLYEMLTGEPPHSGPSPRAVVAKLMTAEPVAIQVLRPGVPPAVEQAVTRALAKVPADRFNTVAEFARAVAQVSTPPAPMPGAVAPASRAPRIIVAAVIVVAIVVVLLVLRNRPLDLSTENTRPVTNEPGVEFQPALSPDGSQVAFVTGRQGRQVIAIRRIVSAAGAGEVIPGKDVDGTQMLPRWSADGETLRFWSGRRRGWQEIGPLGGAAQLIELPRTTPWTAWSRDDKQVALIAGDSLYIYSTADHTTRLLADHLNDAHSPAWSPDGRWIAYVEGNSFWVNYYNVNGAAISIVSTAGGRRVPVVQGGLNVSPAWLDPGHLLFVSDKDGQREVYVAEIGRSGRRGKPRKVPGGTDAHAISVSADGRRLAIARWNTEQNVRVYPLNPPEPVPLGAGERVTTGNQVVEGHDESADGQWIIYDSNLGQAGGSQLYKKRLDGGAPIPLGVEGGAPRWSPDGSEVSFENGTLKLVSADGGTPTDILHNEPGDTGYNAPPHWSPDGLHLAFWSNRSGRVETWMVAPSGAPRTSGRRMAGAFIASAFTRADAWFAWSTSPARWNGSSIPPSPGDTATSASPGTARRSMGLRKGRASGPGPFVAASLATSSS